MMDPTDDDQIEQLRQALTASAAEVERLNGALKQQKLESDAEIERLHTATEQAEERASRRGGRRGEAQALDDARATEEAFLGRFGFQSYSEYLLAGALDPPAAALARHEAAEQKVVGLKAMIDDLQASMTPSTARQILLERADQLAAGLVSFAAHDAFNIEAMVMADIAAASMAAPTRQASIWCSTPHPWA